MPTILCRNKVAKTCQVSCMDIAGAVNDIREHPPCCFNTYFGKIKTKTLKYDPSFRCLAFIQLKKRFILGASVMRRSSENNIRIDTGDVPVAVET